MKIDLRKLYALKKWDVNDRIIIPQEYYEKTDVKDISEVLILGSVMVDYENNIELDLLLKGDFIIPCSISLEEVNVPFEIKVEDKIEENELKDDFYLDLLDVLWENIVLEIPLKVVKEGAKMENIQGEGWEILTEE